MKIKDIYIKICMNKADISQSLIYDDFLSCINNIKVSDTEDVKFLRIILNEIYKLDSSSQIAAKILEFLGDLYSSSIGNIYLNELFDRNIEKYVKKNITSCLLLKKEMISNAYFLSIKLGNNESIVKFIDFILDSKDLNLFKKYSTNIKQFISLCPADKGEIYKLRFIDFSNDTLSCYTTPCVEKLEKSSGNINDLLFDSIDLQVDDDKDDFQYNIELMTLNDFYVKTEIEKKYYNNQLLDVENSLPYSDYDDFFFQNLLDKNKNIEIKNKLYKINNIENNPYFKHFIVENSSTKNYYFGKEYYSINDFTIYSWTSKIYNDLVYEKNNYLKMGTKLTEINIDINDKILKSVNIIYSDGVFNNVFIDDLLDTIAKSHEYGDLKNIIRTISYEQNEILRLPYDTNLIFSGCAGSGKTQVLFHRIKFIVDNNRSINNNLIVISPNKNFIPKVKTLCTDLNIDNINVVTLIDFYSELLNQYTSPIKRSRISWYDLINANNFLDYDRVSLIDDNLLDQSIVEKFYSKDLFDKINGLEAIKIFPITEKRIINNIVNGKLDVLKLLLSQELLDIFPKYNRIPGVVHKCELYALLLCFFKRCNNNHKYQNFDQGYAKEKIDFFYNMFFIDEAQDYNISELVLLNNIRTTNDEKKVFNLYGDIDQNLNTYGLNSWDELKEVGNFQKYSININYRNTKEIVEFINKNFDKNMKSIGLPGENVEYINYSDVLSLLQDNSDIVIICKNVSKFDEIKREVNNCFIDIYSCKGLEFKKVLVLIDDLNSKELYVACSRATIKLFLSSKN